MDRRPLILFYGQVRLAVEDYDSAELEDVHAHLTNYSLNKRSDAFVASDDPDGCGGSKRTVSSVFAALAASGQVADVEALWASIGRVVSRAVTIIQPVLASARRYWPNNPCFQVRTRARPATTDSPRL